MILDFFVISSFGVGEDGKAGLKCSEQFRCPVGNGGQYYDYGYYGGGPFPYGRLLLDQYPYGYSGGTQSAETASGARSLSHGDSDACVINKNKENDGTCDCPNCGDEEELGLDCGECRCPNTCGEPVVDQRCKYRCEGEPLCLIDFDFLNDGQFCDCPNCDDERDSGFICKGQPGGSCDCPSPDKCGTDFFDCLSTRRLATNLSLADAPAQVGVGHGEISPSHHHGYPSLAVTTL